MILDDLFHQATQDSAKGNNNISVEVAFTTNQAGGLKTNTNTASADTATLQYTPQKQQPGPRGGTTKLYAAYFSNSNSSITITAPVPFPVGSKYGVEMKGTTFVPAVDNTTNIVYGAAGLVFVTISICSYNASKLPQ